MKQDVPISQISMFASLFLEDGAVREGDLECAIQVRDDEGNLPNAPVSMAWYSSVVPPAIMLRNKVLVNNHQAIGKLFRTDKVTQSFIGIQDDLPGQLVWLGWLKPVMFQDFVCLLSHFCQFHNSQSNTWQETKQPKA